jgi:hypothetical protein
MNGAILPIGAAMKGTVLPIGALGTNGAGGANALTERVVDGRGGGANLV